MLEVERMKQVRKSHLFLTPNSPRMPYYRRGPQGDYGQAIHWGQRKLLLSEMIYLLTTWNPETCPRPIVVYAGAAPGTHIPYLRKKFPGIVWHLYDPAPFGPIAEDGVIYCFQECFTDELAQMYRNVPDVYFISDIRTSDWKKNRAQRCEAHGEVDGSELSDKLHETIELEALEITEKEVWGDMEMQQKWVMLMDPVYAYLKFRLPWPNHNKPNDESQMQTVPYLAGKIYLQTWAPHTSTETRLLPTRDANGCYHITQWDIQKYEEQCFYHNTEIRDNQKWEWKPESYQGADEPELSTDFDSGMEALILLLYLQWAKKPTTTWEVQLLSRQMTLELNHGSLTHDKAMTLEILRTTPYKASGRIVSAMRRGWFDLHPMEWERCQAHKLELLQSLTPFIAPTIVKSTSMMSGMTASGMENRKERIKHDVHNRIGKEIKSAAKKHRIKGGDYPVNFDTVTQQRRRYHSIKTRF